MSNEVSTIKSRLLDLGKLGIPYVLVTIEGEDGTAYKDGDQSYQVRIIAGGPIAEGLSEHEFAQAVLQDALRQLREKA